MTALPALASEGERARLAGQSAACPATRRAPATWTVLELKLIPPSAFGRAGVVACLTPFAPLPIFSAQTWPHGALRVTSGSFCRLTDGCQPVSFRQVRTCCRANQRHRAFAAGMEELASTCRHSIRCSAIEGLQRCEPKSLSVMIRFTEPHPHLLSESKERSAQ
jgi:hypothetical protein